MKFQDKKSVLYYNILVKIKDEQYLVKRCYKEFDQLHKEILDIYVDNELVPQFPVFTSAQVTIDIRMKKLREYLNEMVKDEFMCDCLLDFL